MQKKSQCERCEQQRVTSWYKRRKNGITELRKFCAACRSALKGKGWKKN